MSTSSSSSNGLSNELSLVNSLSLSLNPYPLILQTIVDQQKKLSHHDLPRFTIILGVVHIILLLVAASTLLLKIFRRRDGERRKVWLWRKHYASNQPIPYLVPNGNFAIEALQICGCVCYLLFVGGVYWVAKYPESTPDFVHAGIMFWHAVALVPGYVAFWLCGWGTFYIGYLVPASDKSSPSKKTIIEHPLVMNTICISVPVLITVYFFGVGIAMMVHLRQVISTYELVTLTLNQLSNRWKANDPTTLENNKLLFDLFIKLSAEANRLIGLAQAEALAGAGVSLVLITFYIVTTITTAKLMRSSIMIANGRKSIFQPSESQGESKDSLNSSVAKRGLISKPQLPGLTFKNHTSLTRLQRSYYFICISSGIMAVALGLNFSTNVIFAIKMKVLVIETEWQARILDLITGTTVTLSVSLFLQSITLTIWG